MDDAIGMGESMKLFGSESPRSETDCRENLEGFSSREGTYAHDSSPANAWRLSWFAS